MENTLDIILESLIDQDWSKIKFNLESKRAFQKIEFVKEKRASIINFGDWILKHKLKIITNNEDVSFWLDFEGNKYTTTEIYNIYLSGDLDIFEDDDEN